MRSIRIGRAASALLGGLALAGCRSGALATCADSPASSRHERAAGLGAPDFAALARSLPATVAVQPSFDPATRADARLVGGADAAPAAEPAAPTQHEAEAGGGGDLARRSADPTEPLMSYSVNEWWSPTSHQLSDDEAWNIVMLRAVVPFKTGCLQHVLRVSQPVYTDTPADVTGIGDVTLFDLLVWKGRGFTYGLGADLTIPWGEGALSSEKWSGGPAAVVMVPHRKWLFGALVQNYFSFAGDDAAPGVAQSIFQPIAVLGLGHGRTIGLSELTFTYDWNREAWTNVPFGLSFAQVTKIHCQPVKFSISADYNFVDRYVAPDWTFRFAVALLFP